MSYPTEGTAIGEQMRDTARLAADLKRVHEAILNATESVNIALGALWGPTPTPPNEKDGPRPVVVGFFPEMLERLGRMRTDADKLAQLAKGLRNL